MDAAFMQSIRNAEVLETFCKAERHLKQHDRILCSVSGGSDSDIMIDILSHCEGWSKVHFVFFDTGVEYEATKRHLDYLEKRYDIKIERVKAETPIPLVVKRYGQPFLSKLVSERIDRLQRHRFDFIDREEDILKEKFPNAKHAVEWWANHYDTERFSSAESSAFTIARTRGLKEYLMRNPPKFSISAKCCDYAKKNTATKIDKKYKCDLKILGLRKVEGGVRAGVYKSCYTKDTSKGYSLYLPLWWWKEADKRYYEKRFDIVHSDCYEVYGMKRTGCAGCPFNRKVIEELSLIEKYEPKLHKACTTMFAESYEYTARFREFQKKFIAEEKEQKKASKFYSLLGDDEN